MNSVELEKVEFSYGANKVLKGLDFSLQEGRIMGFLGPNGSGKTTTIRVINGLLKPQAGIVRIFGRDSHSNIEFVHQNCGVLTETASLYRNLSGIENVKFFASLYGLDSETINKRLKWLDEILCFFSFWDKKVKDMSTGMRKRISLAIALIHSPRILFLDEPTSGLDPETTFGIKKLLKLLANDGVTVFLSTHLLKEAEEICDVFGFIREGKIVKFGSFKEMLKDFPDSFYLKIRGKHPSRLNFVYHQIDNFIFHIPLDPMIKDHDELSKRIIREWIQNGGEIFEAYIEHWNLEKIYFSY